MVAMGLFAVVLLSAGLIFKMSINTQRAASANAEIMQKLRALTDQLNTDFLGLRKDMPLLIWFQQDASDPNQRYDQIMFFADGDFQSIQQYDDSTGKPVEPNRVVTLPRTVTGGTARIFYGQAQVKSGSGFSIPKDMDEEKRILARRCHIFVSVSNYFDNWPDPNNNFCSSFDGTVSNKYKNEWYEHDVMGITRWKLITGSDYQSCVVPDSFDDDRRPLIDKNDPSTYHKLFCEGVSSFGIQWGYWDNSLPVNERKIFWYPSQDPEGNGSTSHFGNKNEFGVLFNVPKFTINNWTDINDVSNPLKYNGTASFPPTFYPKALKFTFRLCDSKGIIKDYDVKTVQWRKGRLFTYIVYIN